MNPLADYIPCAAHSLNLVGVASVNCCLEAVNILCWMNQTMEFVNEGLLPNENGRILTLNTSSSTLWHCHSESVKALYINYSNIYTILNELADNEDEKDETRHSVGVFAEKLCNLETAFMCVLWNIILQRFLENSVLLQSTSLNMANAVAIFLVLKTLIIEFRENFDKLNKYNSCITYFCTCLYYNFIIGAPIFSYWRMAAAESNPALGQLIC